ncbi:hypothetical protein EfmJHP38_28370 [Enterococcus faecium]|nr:hypothetical protein EfmJHP38_28370 [Enterococcus faecium]
MEGFLLNEQTWLQHLKEKRLAYGLSQNRLAVATGITRQYLSDIETGKVKPSEVRDLLVYDNPEHTAFKIINRYIRFVDKDDSKPRSDWRWSKTSYN